MSRLSVVGFMVAAGLVLTACAPATPPATPASAAAAPLTVTDAWASATPGGAGVSGGYLTITNPTAQADTLVAVESPRASHVEIHEMSMEGNVMRMRRVDSIEAPAGGSVSLAPGGMHLMFMDAPEPFAVGESVPVTLTFIRAGEVEVTLPVRGR